MVLGFWGWKPAGFVPLVAIFLPLEAIVEAEVCEEAFFRRAITVGEAI